jgi:16S rRNA processing protein RimM
VPAPAPEDDPGRPVAPEPGADGAPSGPGRTLLGVGKIVKPHGLRGEVIVSLSTNRTERAARGSVLHDAAGRTFEIVRSSPHKGRYIVTFRGVEGVEAAEALRDTPLFAPPLLDDDALWVHDLIGSLVVDAAGAELGTVVGVQANPASDLLVLDGGALIPLRFVTGSEPGVRVEVDVPEGLLDL